MIMPIQLYPAQRVDLPAILEIYNDAVLNTAASWDYEPATLEQRTVWYQQHQHECFPVLVAKNETKQVVGWGALSKFREKIGYQHTVEHSVYVAADYRRQGIGRLIVQALINEAQHMSKHVILGGIEAGNEASLRLHRSLGFEETAYLRQIGYKFDRWLDLILVQKILK